MRFRRGPATVNGYESRKMPLSRMGWEGAASRVIRKPGDLSPSVEGCRVGHVHNPPSEAGIFLPVSFRHADRQGAPVPGCFVQRARRF